MAAFGVDGLVSGLQTTTLINQLMQIEAAPQTLLKSKQTQASALVTALQALNTKVAALGEAATKAAKADSWQAARATSSHEGVTASVTGSSTQAGSISFTVERVATAQVSTTAAVPLSDTIATGDPITITRGTETVTVEPASGSLQDVAAAINAADAGVRASVVRGPSADDGTATYRLQLTGTETGATAGAFEVTGLEGVTTVRQAQDAEITLSNGDTITQASNTFEDLVLGVDVTVTAAAVGQDVSLTLERDTEALTKLASGLVEALGAVLSDISTRTATTTTTDSSGNTVVKGGVFSGDSTIRSLQQALMSAASNPVDGSSPSVAGISIDRYGTFSFDEKVFTEALAADPEKVQSIVAGLAQRVADVADDVSDAYEGTLTLKIQGRQDEVKDLGEQIAAWDLRLEQRREGLQRTYSALEVTLSNLQAQSSWLASQLSSLSASSAG
ncbi:flagellar filament capping protein FliD [Puerhibacterium sp. TATVAM-FAB25]|uniref:flagellar filament capping protein FliD n=1 Tax=Puerhibacterium sp. TATVAM-FAB25 TaxID=3093699 RepID=UPI00397C2E35